MKRILALVAGGVLAAAGCSTLSISTDYDKAADFSSYRTFTWKDTGELKDSLWSKRIEGVFTDTLAAKGLKRVDSGGDLWVAAHPRLSKEMQINTYNTGWGYGYGWYGYGGMGMATTTVTEIPVGTLMIDLVDAKKKELVWRGVASDTLNTDPSRTPEDREKKLRDVAAQMFAGYPPKK
jgi:hypothetical protein